MIDRYAPGVGRLAWRAIRQRSLAGLVRAVQVAVGARRLSPRPDELLPAAIAHAPPIDTGGPYRPPLRPQDPALDPREPSGGESASRGEEHGWSNCTMSSSAAMVGYATAGASLPWGGDMRHHQGDLDGGTDLYDARTALAAYGVTLTIRSGAGWSALVADHDAGHPLVVQGGGRDVPGAGSYSGGHACAIGVGEDSGGRWLLGDPLTDAWQWIAPGDIKAWMEAWQGSCAWGRIPKVATTPPPDQPPDPAPPGQPCPPCPPEDCTDELTRYQDALVGAWMTWLAAPRPGAADVWDGGAWSSPPLAASAILDDPCPPDPTLAPAAWSRGVPFPLSDALEAQATDPAWDGADWRQVAWA